MAITVGKGSQEFDSGIKTRSVAVALVGGLALGGIIAGTLMGNFDRSVDGAANASALTPSRVVRVYENHEQPVTYYIVDSEAQANYVAWAENQAANDREASGVPGAFPIFRVVSVTTPEEAEAAMTRIAEDMSGANFNDLDYRITDMRGMSVPLVVN